MIRFVMSLRTRARNAIWKWRHRNGYAKGDIVTVNGQERKIQSISRTTITAKRDRF